MKVKQPADAMGTGNTGPGAAPPEEFKDEGGDAEGASPEIQSIIVPQSDRVGDQNAAAAWATEQGYAADSAEEMVLEDGRTVWVFHQAPIEEFDAASMQTQDMGDGVQAVMGVRNGESTPSEVEGEGEENMNKAEEVDAPADPEMGTDSPMDAPDDGLEAAPAMKPGAMLVSALYQTCMDMLPMQENEKLVKVCQKLMGDLAGFAGGDYADHNLGIEAPKVDRPEGAETKDMDAEDDGDEKEDEDEDKDKDKPFNKGIRILYSKSLTKAKANVVKEAAEYLDEMASAEGMSSPYKGACKYHASALKALVGGKDDKEDEEVTPQTKSKAPTSAPARVARQTPRTPTRTPVRTPVRKSLPPVDPTLAAAVDSFATRIASTEQTINHALGRV